VQLLGNIFDLNIGHAAKLACLRHAGNMPKRSLVIMPGDQCFAVRLSD
jgi:hypothetical protein